jgi:hypothetical protein
MRRLSRLLMTCASLGVVACNGNHGSSPAPADGDSHHAGDPQPPADPGHGDPLTPTDDGPMPSVDWAVLQFPATADGAIGGSLDLYGRAYEPGVTPGAGRGVGVAAEAGVGLVSAPPANWTWTAATYNTDTDDGANDEYMATVALPSAPGTYRYAFRFSLFGGPWVYADLSPGTTNGFDVLDSGTLIVTPPVALAVDWCRLDGPPAMSVAPSVSSSEVTASVYEAGVTDGGSAGALTGQVGVGPSDSTPDDINWSWTAMAFKADDLNNDVHAASFTAPAVEASYDYAARFRLTAGSGWLLCDRDGSAVDGYSTAQGGKLTVTSAVSPLDWGVIRPASLLWEVVDTPPTVEIEVYEAGVTNANGQGAGIQIEVGIGPTATDPSANGAGWQFAAATYVRDTHGASNNDNDVYAYVMPALAIATHAWVARASIDGGAHWTYIDADEVSSVFDPLKMGNATVVGRRVDWAKIVTPPNAARVTPSTALPVPVAARVQVYEAGLTPGAGMGVGLEVQVGTGPRGGDPTTNGFSYSAATYSRDDDGGGTLSDDQFTWAGVAPLAAGAYDLAARVRIGNSGPWLYADTSGSTATDDPYNAAFALTLSVMDQPSGGVVGWCLLLSPTGETVLPPNGSVTVYGQVYAEAQPGPNATTGSTGTGPTPRGQVGYGPRGSMSFVTDWTWGDLGAFNLWPDASNNDEQLAVLVAPSATGDYDWAWRFSMDGGSSWLYCDDNGATSTGEYLPANAGKLKVQ